MPKMHRTHNALITAEQKIHAFIHKKASASGGRTGETLPLEGLDLIGGPSPDPLHAPVNEYM